MKLRNNNTLGKSAKTIALFLGASALSLTSCRDNDFDWDKAHMNYMQEVTTAYAETFTDMFGEIPADQSWDFSFYAENQGTRTGGTRALPAPTVVGNPSTGNEWLEFGWQSPLQKLLNEKLTEKNENTKSFGEGNVYFVVPNTKFTIYPVMQGLALNWDLYMQVGKMEPELIWKKSHNIQAWTGTNDGYRNLGLNKDDNKIKNYYQRLIGNIDWSSDISNPETYYDYNYVYGSVGTTSQNWGGEDIDVGWITSCFSTKEMLTVSGIQTKGYTFDLRQYAGQPVTFFLKINARSKYFKNVSLGSKMSSTTNQMRFFKENTFNDYKLDFSNLNSLGSKYMLIGIEDADYHLNSSNQLVEGPDNVLVRENGNPITFSDKEKEDGTHGFWALSDYDYNDLVLLIISDEIETTKEDYYAKKTVKKRYMVEDLGTTDDIDFNDMVVDMEQTKWYHYVVTKENGVVKDLSETAVPDGDATHPNTQKATIRALGGTLDFDFKINGTTVFTKSKSQYNVGTMYNTTRNSIVYNEVMWEGTVSGWDPSTNNVSFTVYKNGSSDPSKPVGTYDIVFPNLGEVPYIIAFDPTKTWRDERHPICKKWLADEEDSQWEWPEPHDKEGDMTYEKWLELNPEKKSGSNE